MGANTRPRKPRRQNQLQLAEYICWVSSAVGTVVASTSMQFAYAGVPLSLSLLLNLANRRRIEVVTHQRTMGAVVRVQQQLSQDLVAIEQRLRQVAEHHPTEIPTQSQLRLQQLHYLAQQTSDSEKRIRDLDDFRLVYQEIESAIAQIRRDFGVMYDRLAHSLPIDVTRHTASDTLSDTLGLNDDLSGHFEDLDHLQDLQSRDVSPHPSSFENDALDQIFEADRPRDILERRTITLPLEQFTTVPNPPAPLAEPATPDPTWTNATDDDGGDDDGGDDDGVFDADILTEDAIADATTDTGIVPELQTLTAIDPEAVTASALDSALDSGVKPRLGTEGTIGETHDRLEARDIPETATPRRPRPTIELFSPHATPPVTVEPAPNAIPSIDLDQTSIDPTAQVTPDPLVELARPRTPTVSFALTTSSSGLAETPHRPATSASDRGGKTSGITLPPIDAEAIAPPVTAASNRAPGSNVPSQDWQRLSTLTDHGDWVSDLVIDPTGTILISASFDRTIQFWNLQSGESLKILSEHSSPVCAIALSRDQGWLVSGSWDRTIKIWDLESQSLLETLVDNSGVAGSVRSLAVSPNGRWIASGWFDRTIALWDVRITPKRRKVSVSACGSHLAHGGRVDAIAFDPTGKRLASASADGTVKLWSVDGNTGELDLLNTLSDSADPINAITFSRDGMTLIDANRDRTLRIWDVETGELLHKLSGHSSSVTAVAAHPDGETLISGSSDGTVRLWHLPTGQPIAMLSGSRDAVMSVAVSEDGRMLVSGSADGSIDVWRRWGMAG